MSFEVFLSDNARYIVCRVNGPLDVDLAWDFTRELYRLSRDTCVDCFLFDVQDARNVSTTIDNFNFAHSVEGEADLQASARAAILVAPGDTSHDSIQQMLSHSGLHARIFDDLAAAIAWLEAPAR